MNRELMPFPVNFEEDLKLLHELGCVRRSMPLNLEETLKLPHEEGEIPLVNDTSVKSNIERDGSLETNSSSSMWSAESEFSDSFLFSTEGNTNVRTNKKSSIKAADTMHVSTNNKDLLEDKNINAKKKSKLKTTDTTHKKFDEDLSEVENIFLNYNISEDLCQNNRLTEKLNSDSSKSGDSKQIDISTKANITAPAVMKPTQKKTVEVQKPLKESEPKIQWHGINVREYSNTPLVKSGFKTPPNISVKQLKPFDTKKPNLETCKENVHSEGEIQQMFKVISVNGISFMLLNILGKGGSSVVYHCYEPKKQRHYAIKCVDLDNNSYAVSGFINEVKTLSSLQHCDRIIKMYMYEILKNEKKLYVVLEKGGKDLAQILKHLATTSVHLPMYMLIYYWMEILHAVEQIHANGVIHSDLKPSNFIEVKGRIKLIDFGIASCIQKDMTSVVKNCMLGTFNYISPEALTNTSSNNCNVKISFKSDVWSVGCILYQLVYRKTPFDHVKHTSAKIATLIDRNHVIDYPEADWVPTKIISTIKDCLIFDMRSRPTITELIARFERISY